MRACFVSLGLLHAVSGLAQAPSSVEPVPVEQEPHHKTVFLNEAIRVLEVVVPVGGATADHSHLHDVATVCIGCAVTQTRAPGEPWSEARVRKPLGVLVAEYTGQPAAHAVRNIDNETYRLLGVENRRPVQQWSKRPPARIQGATLTQEARSFLVYDVHLAMGGTPVMHTHELPVVAVLATGEVVSGSPGEDSTRLTRPGEWRLVPAGKPHQLGAPSGAAHVVELEVR